MAKYKFRWGDAVKVVDSAPNQYHPGHSASICGLRNIPDEDISNKTGFKLHSNVYLIEYGDCFSLEIEEEYIELAED